MNTQDSPLDMEINFCQEANNCVIDRYGRISSRNGFQYLTTNPTVLNGNPIVAIFEFIPAATDVSYVFACGNNKIFMQQQVAPFELVEMTLPVGYVVTDDNWQMASLKNKCYFVQAGHKPLVFEPSVSETALREWAEYPRGADPIYPNTVHAAFGRLWTSAYDDDSGLVFFSGLLDGENYSSQGTGSFDTALYWPAGFDKITSVVAHNNFLIVFGERNILVYNTTSDVVSTLSLTDTVEGIGCIARDSVVGTGVDYMFIDSTGVRALNRTIQEKSVPIGDISKNIRNDFQLALANEPKDDIKAVFHVEDSFYACFLPSNPKTYCFDTWQLLPDGSGRATVWTLVRPTCGVRLQSRQTFFAGNGGVYIYQGGNDLFLDPNNVFTPTVGEIPMSFITHPIDFGDPVSLVFPKQVDVTIFGAVSSNLTLKWGYDYKRATEPQAISKDPSDVGTFTLWYPFGTSVDEPNVGEYYDPFNDPPSQDGQTGYYTTGDDTQQLKYNVWGSGRNIRLGFFSNIFGAPLSLQEINVQALFGRIL